MRRDSSRYQRQGIDRARFVLRFVRTRKGRVPRGHGKPRWYREFLFALLQQQEGVFFILFLICFVCTQKIINNQMEEIGTMSEVKLFSGEKLPLEMHKVRVVQKLNLLPVEARQKAMAAAGNNTFLLRNEDVYLDMLTDSGVNAMSDQAVASMMVADDGYAGSATYYRLESKI